MSSDPFEPAQLSSIFCNSVTFECSVSPEQQYNSLITVDKKRMKKEFSIVFPSASFSFFLFYTKSMTFNSDWSCCSIMGRFHTSELFFQLCLCLIPILCFQLDKTAEIAGAVVALSLTKSSKPSFSFSKSSASLQSSLLPKLHVIL